MLGALLLTRFLSNLLPGVGVNAPITILSVAGLLTKRCGVDGQLYSGLARDKNWSDGGFNTRVNFRRDLAARRVGHRFVVGVWRGLGSSHACNIVASRFATLNLQLQSERVLAMEAVFSIHNIVQL